MTKFFRVLMLGLAICCLTWVGVLWWWQRSGRVIAEVDMAVYLGLLPLVLWVLIAALRRAWTRAGALASAQQAAPQAQTTGSAELVGAPSEDERTRHATLRLVHAAFLCTGGAQASDLLQAASDGKPMPVPDKLLVGDAGLPILCARLPDTLLVLEGCRDRLDTLVKRLHREDERRYFGQPGEAVVRALAALQEPLLAQRQWLLDQAMRGFGSDAPQDAELPRVRLMLGCAAHWSLLDQALAQRWVEALWAGDDDATASSYVLQVFVVPGSGEDLWLKADQAAYATHEHAAPAWLLLAAAHGELDQQRIDVLSSAGRLYDSRMAPGGYMPGEAAATVLIAPSNWTVPQDLAFQPVLLHRPALMRRCKPVEAPGKVDSQVARQAVAHAMAAARLPTSQLTALVCDADQHSPRATELYGVTIGDMSQLDPLEDMRVLGKVTGNVGAASCLLVVACASEWARALRKPVLALGMADSHMRLALVIKPDLPEDAAAHESDAANRTS